MKTDKGRMQYSMQELMAEFYDGPHATPPASADGPIFLGIKNLTEDGHFDYSEDRRISEDDYSHWIRRVEPRPGDLVFTYEASLHRYAILPEGFRGCLGRRIALIRVNPNVANTHFLLYYFLSPEWKATVLQRLNIGSTVDRIPLSEFPKFPVSIPGLEEQRQIAAVLSAYDELIENNSRRIEILEEMAQAIYREWFVEFRYPGHEDVPLVDSELGPIPEGWAVSNLGSVCSRVQAGGTPSRKNSEFWDDGVINWFRTTELQDGFLFDSSEKISQAGLEGSSAKMFEAGSILMAIYGSPTVGRLGILTRDATCNQAALALVPDETVISHPFLYQTLTSMREHFNSIAQGAAQQNISKATVAGTLMVLPPRPLVDLYDQVAVPIWDLTRTLTEQLGNLRETRDILLPKLISGEIDVSELDIELAGSSV